MVIILILLTLVTGSVIKYKGIFNPISVVSVWWCGWLWVCTMSFTGMFVPNLFTQFLTMTMVISFAFGAFIVNYSKDNGLVDDFKNVQIYHRYKKMFFYSFISAHAL